MKETNTLKRLSCRNLKLSRFIDALVDDEMSEDLRAQWSEIRDEYYELSQNKSFSGTYFLMRDLEYLNRRLEIIQLSVDELRKVKDDNLILVLRNYDFDFTFSPQTYKDDLDAVVTRSQTEALELEQKQDEWGTICNRSDKTPPTHDFFGSWLDAISDDGGYIISANKITVADYCRRCNKIQERALKSNKTKP